MEQNNNSSFRNKLMRVFDNITQLSTILPGDYRILIIKDERSDDEHCWENFKYNTVTKTLYAQCNKNFVVEGIELNEETAEELECVVEEIMRRIGNTAYVSFLGD